MALLATLMGACDSETTDSHKVADCDALLTYQGQTYYSVPTDMPIEGERVGRGTLSDCAQGVAPRTHTGMFTMVYEVPGFGTDRALVSRAIGDPAMLWIATKGLDPPFEVPSDLQALVDEYPVPKWMREGTN
jgi:hypothetical protein